MKFLKTLTTAAVLAATSVAATAGTFVGPRTDFRDETIYFAMTTRFYDGDPTNNVYCWDGDKNVNDPEWRGDFKGLIAKLDYLKALGFTAVWITPVVENASGLDYHGYHAFNFSKVDPRYESEDTKFQDLIDEAHKRGMKIVLDVVLQHTGNFGEDTLCPMFVKDYSQNLSNINKSMKLHPNTGLPSNYASLEPGNQYDSRLRLMKNPGKGNDVNNHYHHVGQGWDWDDYSRVWAQIAGDCVDLNTENPEVYNYLIKCYGNFIKMGVDGFRVDTSGHIARVTFNKAFIPGLLKIAEEYKDKRGGTPFFMYGEVCARAEEIIYRNGHYNCSACYYTWAEDKDYKWTDDATEWQGADIARDCNRSAYATYTNTASVLAQEKDDASNIPTQKSSNHLLDGNKYRKTDYSKSSHFSVIDFPMHWRFHNVGNAFNAKDGDYMYNDATYNVVYVDSHDYGPNNWDTKSFGGGKEAWAENLALMFTFRGIPCVYQGTETQFRKGYLVDKGALEPLSNTARAYYGGYLTGDVTVSDFAEYTDATGNLGVSLKHPIALHLQRLNKIRAAVPALRKGQYSTDGCSGSLSFKRRYTDDTTDSYVLVTINGSSTFTNIPAGTYTDVVTGDVKVVKDGESLTATCSGRGNLRAYVLSTALTPAPGKVGVDGPFIFDKTAASVDAGEYDGNQEAGDYVTKRDNSDPDPIPDTEKEELDRNPITPSMQKGEQAVFFEGDWSRVNAYTWNNSTEYFGKWSGSAMTYQGNKVWKINYTDKVIPKGSGLIFNNGGSSQTKNLEWVNGGYYTVDGFVKRIDGAEDLTEEPDPDPVVDNYVVYFDNSLANWGKVYAYSWYGSGSKYLGDWPGKQLTETATLNGKEYYTVTVPVASTHSSPMIIFSNGNGTQTSDLTLRNYAIYNHNGDTGGSGIIDLEATDAYTAPVYYNLQGVRVDNPTRGIYIVRIGNQVKKVLLQ